MISGLFSVTLTSGFTAALLGVVLGLYASANCEAFIQTLRDHFLTMSLRATVAARRYSAQSFL